MVGSIKYNFRTRPRVRHQPSSFCVSEKAFHYVREREREAVYEVSRTPPHPSNWRDWKFFSACSFSSDIRKEITDPFVTISLCATPPESNRLTLTPMDVDFRAYKVHSAKHFSTVQAARIHTGLFLSLITSSCLLVSYILFLVMFSLLSWMWKFFQSFGVQYCVMGWRILWVFAKGCQVLTFYQGTACLMRVVWDWA